MKMMRKKILFFIFILFFLLFPKKAEAIIDCPFTATPIPSFTAPVNSITLSFDGKDVSQELNNYPSGGQLKFSFPGVTTCGRPNVTNVSKPEITINYDDNILTRCDDDLLSPGMHKVEIIYEWPGGTEVVCETKSYTIEPQPLSCQVETRYDGLGDVDDITWRIAVWNLGAAPVLSRIEVVFDNGKEKFQTAPHDFEKDLPVKIRTAGVHTVAVYSWGVWGGKPTRGKQMCAASFEIAPRGATPQPTPTPGGSSIPTLQPKLQDICKKVSDNPGTPQDEKQDCIKCLAEGRAYTAIGCVPTDISALLKDYIFVYGLGIAGGIAFLLMLFGGFTILSSAGNPENVAKGKEMITSAIAGLLIIIFSVFILRIIGVDILRIPGFK